MAGIGAGIGPDRPYTRLLNLPSRCTRREASLFFRIQNLGWDEGVSVLHWFFPTQVMRTNQFQGQIWSADLYCGAVQFSDGTTRHTATSGSAHCYPDFQVRNISHFERCMHALYQCTQSFPVRLHRAVAQGFQYTPGTGNLGTPGVPRSSSKLFAI
jgi:hypothetical protein